MKAYRGRIFPEGACGTPGVSPRPRRRVCRHATGTPGALCLQHRAAAAQKSKRRGHLSFSPQKGSPPRKQVLRLRSALGWTLRLAACPRRRRSADAFPFVRAIARTCTWAVRPLRRCHPLEAVADSFDPDSSSRGRHRCGHRTPLHVTMTLATRPLMERDARL